MLSDDARRAAYDQHGAAGAPQQAGRTHRGGGFGGFGAGFKSADEIFKDFFGGEDPFKDFAAGAGGGGGGRVQASSFSFSFGNGRIKSMSQSQTVTDEHGRTVTRRLSSELGADGERVQSAEVERDGGIERRELTGAGQPPPPSLEPAGSCLAFRRTGACSPDGPREAFGDLGCLVLVPAGVSGFCECTEGRTWPMGCGHAGFLCVEACAELLEFPLDMDGGKVDRVVFGPREDAAAAVARNFRRVTAPPWIAHTIVLG